MLGRLSNNDLGAYLPGFFKMELDLELRYGFKWSDFSDSQKATVLHEYIHYLQDISTTHGISNFNFLTKIINMYLYKISTNNNEELIVPIDIEKSNVENAYIQSELVGIYNGDETHKRIHHVNKISREIEDCYQMQFNQNEDPDEDMYNINIYYDDKDIPYRFGNHCIAESMAYMIEVFIYPIHIRKNEFPYNACELLCNELYPEISNNFSCIAAMCDISLMHYHSGDFFYHLLLDMKENKFLPRSSEDVYRYAIPQIKHLYENFIRDFSEAIENVNFLYNKDLDMLTPINIWLTDKLAKARDFRLKHHNFITKLMNFKNCKDAEIYLMSLMNTFELPLITDNAGQVFSGESNLTLMLAPIALIELFTKSSDFKCYMYKYCIINGEPQVCSLCLTEPWKNAEEKYLCPLALYWHRFSLTGRSLKRK